MYPLVSHVCPSVHICACLLRAVLILNYSDTVFNRETQENVPKIKEKKNVYKIDEKFERETGISSVK